MEATDAGTISLNLRGPTAFGDFAHEWRRQIGTRFSLPAFSPATIADFRVRSRAVRVRDVVFNGFDTTLAIRTTGGPVAVDDHLRLWIVRRGAWLLGDERRGVEHVVPAGRLVAQAGALSHFAAEPNTMAQVLVLPAAAVDRPLRGRTRTGPADAAEVRVLVAHADMIRRALGDLGPAGRLAARDTLVELARAATFGGLDDLEPRLAPALAQAARNLADRRLTDPDLSPALLARELNVSVRTLQRAFAADGQSITAYIRDRRLEEARSALTAPGRRLSISEIAARWQFADSSHFGRVFKQRYGRTPSDHVRESRRPRSTPPD